MQLPASDHPVWPIIRWVIVSATLFLFLKYNYVSGFTPVDWVTIFGTMGALAGFDIIKRTVSKG